MNNEELKKKILVIVRGAMLEADGLPFIETTDNIADALIAAGIVDKSDYASMKETAVRYKAEVSKAGARVKEAEAEANRYEMLYKLQNRDMALAERRAHDAERRAARAERALRDAFEIICNGIYDVNEEVAEALKQAEAKLAELEGKEE